MRSITWAVATIVFAFAAVGPSEAKHWRPASRLVVVPHASSYPGWCYPAAWTGWRDVPPLVSHYWDGTPIHYSPRVQRSYAAAVARLMYCAPRA